MSYRRVPIVATLVTFGISSLWRSLLSEGRYFRGTKIVYKYSWRELFFRWYRWFTGLPYHMGELADIEEIEFFTDSEMES